MKYTTSIKKGTFDRPIGELDKNGHRTYDKHEHYDIDVVDVTMQSKIDNNEDIKSLTESLYPELISILGNNQYIGVRLLLDRTIKFIFSKEQTFNDFQRTILRQYSAMRLDIDVFGLDRENN